ncbi:MAG TPA: ATP-binding protein [Solirubrobacteraceae bacterium]|nr:ATP-binding protein [Solirubrobacteraceae bacterium]
MSIPANDVAVGDGGERTAYFHEQATKLVDGSAVTDELEALWRATDGSSAAGAMADFPAARDSPGRARRLIVAALTQWGCATELVQDAAVVASELATNAVLHAGSPFSISGELQDGLLRLAVEDACPLSVAMRGGRLSPQPTHGLGLVEAMSVRWGVEGSPRGKVIWAELGTDVDARQAVLGESEALLRRKRP